MAKFGTNKNCPIKQCRKFTVEGSTDRGFLDEYLEHLGVNDVYIEAAHGKGEVMEKFKAEYNRRSILLPVSQRADEEGWECFFVDGDDQGYKGVVQELNEKGIQGGVQRRPYVIFPKQRILLGVVGDPENDFSGSLESLLLRGRHKAMESEGKPAKNIEPTGNSKKDKDKFESIKKDITKYKQSIFKYIDSKYCLPDDEKDE